jgi:hypothetical protein
MKEEFVAGILAQNPGTGSANGKSCAPLSQ